MTNDGRGLAPAGPARVRVRLVNRATDDPPGVPEPTGVKSARVVGGKESSRRLSPQGPAKDKTKAGRAVSRRVAREYARKEALLLEASTSGRLDPNFWEGFVGAMDADALFEMACASPGLARVVEGHYAGRVVWGAGLLEPKYAHVDARFVLRLELTEPPVQDERSRALNLRELRLLGDWDPGFASDGRLEVNLDAFGFAFHGLSLTLKVPAAVECRVVPSGSAAARLSSLRMRLSVDPGIDNVTLESGDLGSLRALTAEVLHRDPDAGQDHGKRLSGIEVRAPISLVIVNSTCDVPAGYLGLIAPEGNRLSRLCSKKWLYVDFHGEVPSFSHLHGDFVMRYDHREEGMVELSELDDPGPWRGLTQSLTHLTGAPAELLDDLGSLGVFERVRVVQTVPGDNPDPEPGLDVETFDSAFPNCTRLCIEWGSFHPWSVARACPRLEVLMMKTRKTETLLEPPRVSIREIFLECLDKEAWVVDGLFLPPFLTSSLRSLVVENFDLETPTGNAAIALRSLELRRCDLSGSAEAFGARQVARLSLDDGCTMRWEWYRPFFGADATGRGRLERLSIRDSTSTPRTYHSRKYNALEGLLRFHARLIQGELGASVDWSRGIGGLRRLVLEQWDPVRSNLAVLGLPESLRRLDLLDPDTRERDKTKLRDRTYPWDRTMRADWLPSGVEEVVSALRFLGPFRPGSRLRRLTYTDRWTNVDAAHASDATSLRKMAVPHNLPSRVEYYAAPSVTLDPWDDRRLPESVRAGVLRVAAYPGSKTGEPPVGLPLRLRASEFLVEDVETLPGVRNVTFDVFDTAAQRVILDEEAHVFSGRLFMSSYVHGELGLAPARLLAPKHAVVGFVG